MLSLIKGMGYSLDVKIQLYKSCTIFIADTVAYFPLPPCLMQIKTHPLKSAKADVAIK